MPLTTVLAYKQNVNRRFKARKHALQAPLPMVTSPSSSSLTSSSTLKSHDKSHRPRSHVGRRNHQQKRHCMIISGFVVFGLVFWGLLIFILWRFILSDDLSSTRAPLPHQMRHLQHQHRDTRKWWQRLFQPRPKSRFDELLELEDHMARNAPNDGIDFSHLLPTLSTSSIDKNHQEEGNDASLSKSSSSKDSYTVHGQFFRVNRSTKRDEMTWLVEDSHLQGHYALLVDYTRLQYSYPAQEVLNVETYPNFSTLHELLTKWPLTEIDKPPTPMIEHLQHFDYSNPTELDLALQYRDAQVPFKLINVPDLLQAKEKWTEDYLSSQLDGASPHTRDGSPRPHSSCTESVTSYFPFFMPNSWVVDTMGLPPSRINDMTFQEFSQHAKYADTVQLAYNQPHFYFQSGIDKQEREMPPSSWSFITRDLPLFGQKNETFIQFHHDENKGVQCRFGERGVTAATHFDQGQNMVGMISGAKRYILSPPNQCSRLGIQPNRGHATYRHSLLNFANYGKRETLSSRIERNWLERAGSAQAIETVLKAGEVLFIPSFWFHTIVALQQNIQCNVRSGVTQGTQEFGGPTDVSPEQCRA